MIEKESNGEFLPRPRVKAGPRTYFSKESACNKGDTGDLGLIPRLGRSPGGGNGNPLQYSSQENSMDRGA